MFSLKLSFLCLLPSPDELAKFLIYVRTLGYEDKPDYQLLKKLLVCEVTGRLDFSVPGGHQGSAPKEPFNREKVRTEYNTTLCSITL